MQAKGITGNVLPNNNEVGGRSGEGRSGKSSGQFVEKTATGKGGRKTPTRLTQSPYEKGTVEDTSKDPQGGASGGGKQSGSGGEGLIGVTPDQDPDIKERLSGSQGELRQRAEALLRKLGKRQLPTGDLREALNKMAQLKKLQVNGSPKEISKLKGEINIALKNARTALILSINAGQEKVRRQKMKISPSNTRKKKKCRLNIRIASAAISKPSQKKNKRETTMRFICLLFVGLSVCTGENLLPNGNFDKGKNGADKWEKVDNLTSFWTQEKGRGRVLKLDSRVDRKQALAWQKKLKSNPEAKAPAPIFPKNKYTAIGGNEGAVIDSELIDVIPGKLTNSASI